MARVLIFLFFILFGDLANAAISLQVVNEIPGNEGKCQSPDKNIFFNPGEVVYDTEQCLEFSCFRTSKGANAGKLYMRTAGCAPLNVSPPCQLGPGKSNGNYPECCPKPHCP